MDPVLGQQQQQMYNPYGSVPTLPTGWTEHRTPTGQPYWFNTMTGQSSWVYPVATVLPPPTKKKQIKKKIPGTHWLFVTTHDAYEFYYDRDTKTSVWEMPDELKEPMEELKRLEKEAEEAKNIQEEQDKKRALEEEEEQLEAKRVKLEREIVQEAQDTTDTKEQELDATEMTEEDIMWQLQQMEGSEQEEEEEEQAPEEEQTEEVAPVVVEEKKPELSEEERILQFNELLKERQISPFAMYSTECPHLMNDPRFSLVPPNKQKSLFNKYCHDLGEKLKNEKKNQKKPEDAFKELLGQVTKKMYWDDFRRKYKDDPRFKAIKVTKEKEALFKDHIKHHLNKVNPDQAYLNLLKESKLSRGMRWRDAKKLLELDDRYHLVTDKEKREDLFRDYLETI